MTNSKGLVSTLSKNRRTNQNGKTVAGNDVYKCKVCQRKYVINPKPRGHSLASWAEKYGVLLAFIEPDKPAQNGYIEPFNRTYREDVLDFYLFSTLVAINENALCKGIEEKRLAVENLPAFSFY